MRFSALRRCAATPAAPRASRAAGASAAEPAPCEQPPPLRPTPPPPLLCPLFSSSLSPAAPPLSVYDLPRPAVIGERLNAVAAARLPAEYGTPSYALRALLEREIVSEADTERMLAAGLSHLPVGAPMAACASCTRRPIFPHTDTGYPVSMVPIADFIAGVASSTVHALSAAVGGPPGLAQRAAAVGARGAARVVLVAGRPRRAARCRGGASK